MKAFAAILFCAIVASCSASMTYTYQNTTETAPSTQLWYEGHWKEFPALNGTITWSLNNTKGKIFMSDRFGPHETDIRKAQAHGAVGVVFVRPGNFPPGFSMHIIDGSDRRDLVIPVMEVVYPRYMHVKEIPEGSFVVILPSLNRHKQANETPFQLIFNLIQSFWALAIISIGLHRIYHFYAVARVHFLSVGPICCILEVIAACLRLAYTCVDPFYTYRMLPDKISILFVSISIPFAETAGILLTFFWAESLNKHNIKATPFISQYKWAAFVAIALLFAIEIFCAALRFSSQNFGPVAIYVTLALYLVVAVVLVVCYIVTSIAILRRIENLGVRRGRKMVKSLTMRIVVIAGGYIIVIIALISYAIFSQYVLGRALALNAVFIGFNLAGIMQVYALRPPSSSKSSSGPSKPSSAGNSGKNVESSQIEDVMTARI